MRKGLSLTLALASSCLLVAPAFAITITARVSGGPIPIHEGPGNGYAVVGYADEGAQIPIDQCTQNDSDSRHGVWGDAGIGLRGANASQWCRIPDYGWVSRGSIVGRGLVNVTPPDFAGAGW